MLRKSLVAALVIGICVAGLASERRAAPPVLGQWGAWQTRNMVAITGKLPDRVDPDSGLNVRWTAPLGGQTHATPVVAGDRILIGTNNERPRDPRLRGDCGVLMCLDARTGKLVWQFVVPKVGGSPYNDWPATGLCSAPTVEGDRVYVITNRNELACLDLAGMSNGNEGPYRDEGRHMVAEGAPPVEPGPQDADIVWLLDIVQACGTNRHDAAHGSPLVDGDVLYVNTSNGVDDNHMMTPALGAPNLIAVNKRTGALIARDGLRIGERIIHAAWSSPALCAKGGRRLVIYGGGDGVCYAFSPAAPREPATLGEVWRFDGDPDAPKEGIFRWQDNRKEGPSTITAMPVVAGGRAYVVAGGDLWHGKPQSWLHCVDPGKTGDVTRSARIWTYPFRSFGTATPAVLDGLAYIVASDGVVHCVDAANGSGVWTHDTQHETWSSPMLADGKLYVTSRTGYLTIMATGRSKRVLSSVRLDGAMSASPAASGTSVYAATMRTLYAFGFPK